MKAGNPLPGDRDGRRVTHTLTADRPPVAEQRPRPGGILLAFVLAGVSATAVVALAGVRVTTGWLDQSKFHFPTIRGLAEQLPVPDVVNVRTATGPLMHLTLAIPTRLLGLPETAVQILNAAIFWTLLMAATFYATRSLPRGVQVSVMACVALSPYILQGTLWITTDPAAAALFVLALAAAARFQGWAGEALLLGLVVAAAIATRQTAVWLLAPVLLAVVSAGTPRAVTARNCALVALPGIAVLGTLVTLWGGLLPPMFVGSNGAGANPTSIPVGFMLWAFFAAPLLIATPQWTATIRRNLPLVVLGGSGAAAPAVIWPSAYEEAGQIREGGWPWELIRATGSVADRAPLLIALAFVGGAAVTALLAMLWRSGRVRATLVVGSGIFGSIASAAAAANAWPKYSEMPLLACFVVLVAALWPLVDARRWWTLLVPTGLQVLAGAAIVGLPVAAALAG